MARTFFEGVSAEVSANFNTTSVPITVAKELLYHKKKNQELEQQQIDSADGQSYLGTLTHGELIIESGSYYPIGTSTNDGEPVPYDGLKIQNVLIDITMTKNIIQTDIAGRDNPVFEYISQGAWSITVFGLLNGENFGDLRNDAASADIQDIGNFYPTRDRERLEAIMKVPASIRLISDHLTFSGISDCIVTNYNIPQERGKVDTQIFQINLLSDVAPELDELEIT